MDTEAVLPVAFSLTKAVLVTLTSYIASQKYKIN